MVLIGSRGNFGCGGGDPLTGLRYAKTAGLSSSTSYPYKSKASKCKPFSPISKISRITKVDLNGNENRLKQIVATYGPVAVGINAADSLMNYMMGVYDNPKCSKQYDHAVLLVGMNEDMSKLSIFDLSFK